MRDTNFLILILASLIILLSSKGQAQNYHNYELKANQLRKSAKHAEREKDYFSAIDFYEKYLIKKPSDYKAAFSLAEMYRLTRDYNRARQQYQKAFALEEEKNLISLYYLGRMEMTQESYEESIETFKTFRKKYRSKKDDFNYRKYAKIWIEGCELAMSDSIQKEKLYLTHIDRGINMAYNEFSPLPVGNDLIIFSSIRSDTIIHYEDSTFKDTSSYRTTFHLGKKEDDKWKYVKKMDGPFEFNDANVSNACFSLDSTFFYFTICKTNWKYEIICNIYYTEKSEGGWLEPIKLNDQINHKKFSSTQPAMGLNPKNGNEILYFASNNPNGRGGFDLW